MMTVPDIAVASSVAISRSSAMMDACGAVRTGDEREDRARPAAARLMKRVAGHHHVYVVFLKNPKGDGRAGYYVGMTGLTPEERLANHKAGIKAARVVQRFGVRLVPRLYAHLNPMSDEEAVRMEAALADSLRKRGFQVFGGH